ncbi:Hsp20/alpha crystallin family protein [Agriterribacter sp.]|uniref:Hsp20/alpha crystallin family protein n=1 Tax=Agriterribacter sp. TaxID=2821509 RepID=UPI002BF746B9|nr:Hsp20/alpha crystallin family protein [Agriterribacter sp.]HRP54783.1 Hsp20/alpha crystallin family protein [Agriterribacter sp.]
MTTQALTRLPERMPSFFDDFFRPWNEWAGKENGWSTLMNLPAVNISEQKNEYQLSVAVPGMKKDDFKLDVEGNILTISSEKEESKEEKDKKFTRKEYNYSSFSRCFTLPGDVEKDKAEATYEEGILKVSLPRKASAKSSQAKHIAVK